MVAKSAPPLLAAGIAASPETSTIDLRDENRDVANYVSHMTSEMAAMSRAAGYDLLAYFLDMARIEANIQAGRRGE